MRSIVRCCLLALFAASTAWAQLDVDVLPQNVAVYAGSNVTHSCWVSTATGTPRIQWYEYAYSPSGGLISDGDLILPTHPQSERYSLVRVNLRQYDLHIRDVTRADGGTYTCVDSNAPILTKQRHSAELIVIAGSQNCTTTIPTPPMSAVEGVYYSTECECYYQGNIAPYMWWTGPPPFGQGQSTTPTTIWSGKSFYASRTMSSQFWVSQTNFTNNFLPVPADSASNIPDFVDNYETDRVTVSWSPGGMYADPVKPLDEYEVGDTLECFADAFPTAQFEWHNTRTNDRFLNSLFVIPATWLGTEQAMRCIATNIINNLPYTNEMFIQVNVPLPTTTPEPTTPTTTTPPLPESSCLDLSGRWRSIGPTPAVMCIEEDSESGLIHGVMRNATDSFWLDVVGQVDLPGHNHASWTAIWPLNRAVSTFIGECSRCFGVETLLMNVISRSKGGPPCATPGEIRYSEQYHFERHPIDYCPPITIPT